MQMKHVLAAIVILNFAVIGLAVEVAASEPAATAPATHVASAEPPEAIPHPTISADASWARSMAMGILAFFVGATVIGIMVRSESPQVIPEATSHDESAGSAHH